MSIAEPILAEFLTRKNSPLNCGEAPVRSTVGKCSAWARHGRLLVGKFFTDDQV